MIENVNELLTEQSHLSAQRSYDIAIQHRQDVIDVSHVFLALLDFPDDTLSQVLNSLAIDIDRLKSETLKVIELQSKVPFWKGKKYQMFITPLVKQSINEAITLSKELEEEKASSVHIFWGVINSCVKNHNHQTESQRKMSQTLNKNSIVPEKILKALEEINYHSKDEQKD